MNETNSTVKIALLIKRTSNKCDSSKALRRLLSSGHFFKSSALSNFS